MNKLRPLVFCLPLAITSACVLSQENGETFTGDTNALTFDVEGYVESPGQRVRVQALSPADQNPTDPSSLWVTVGRGSSSAVAYHHPTEQFPAYPYKVATMIRRNNSQATRWLAGGLARTRVQVERGGSWSTLTTFDDIDCVKANKGENFQTISARCSSHDPGVLTLVSTEPLPGAANFLGRTANAPKEASDYYAAVGAGPNDHRYTFAGWLNANGFPSSGQGVSSATYYNLADLGVGREMHCRENTPSAPPPGQTEPGPANIACHVTNYGSFVDGLDDEVTATKDAINKDSPVATVAMEWRPGGGPNDVRFFVYSQPSGTILEDAQLDSEQPKPMPGLCLACHGGTYSDVDDSVRNAKFLPFDLDAFSYSNERGWTRADQAEEFRRLNRIVETTQPTPAIGALIDGWYGGQVATPRAQFDGDYVPPTWSTEPTVYKEVVVKYCRMCHQSREGLLDFAERSDFTTLAPTIVDSVCGSHEMPHAEIPHTAFWQSSARAHLFGGVLGNHYPACD